MDGLQLALGARADAGRGARGLRASEIAAEFDSPASLAGWLDEAGFAVDETLLLRRVVDAQGKSRAFVNGSAATITQLREVADHLIDIHGQHAWQSLTRPAAVRALLDEQAGIDAAPVAAAPCRVGRGHGGASARASARASSTPNASAWPGSWPRWSACRRRTTSGSPSPPNTAGCRTRSR